MYLIFACLICRDTYKDIHDLKGHRWAYNDEVSITGNVAVLAELKKMGETATFFGDVVKSGETLHDCETYLDIIHCGILVHESTCTTIFILTIY